MAWAKLEAQSSATPETFNWEGVERFLAWAHQPGAATTQSDAEQLAELQDLMRPPAPSEIQPSDD